MPNSEDVALLADIALATGAAAAGVVDPGLGVVAAGTAVGLSNRFRIALERRATRNLVAAAEGVRSVGTEIAPAIDALLRTDEGLALVASALRGIAVAAFTEKARALGTCIGRAGIDGSEVAAEAELVWARLIEQLQRRHVVALLALQEPEVERLDPSIIHSPDHYTIEREYKRTRAFSEALGPYDGMTADSVRADLNGWGLARSVRGAELHLKGGAMESDTFWLPTPLGNKVTERLRRDVGVADADDVE